MPATPRELQKLADEIAQHCLCQRARQLSRNVTALYDHALVPLNLTANQFTVLVMLAAVGPVRQGRIGQILTMDKSTVSRTVGRLARMGHVQTAAGDDGRQRRVALTAHGRQAVRRGWALWRRAQQEANKALGPDLTAALSRLGPLED